MKIHSILVSAQSILASNSHGSNRHHEFSHGPVIYVGSGRITVSSFPTPSSQSAMANYAGLALTEPVHMKELEAEKGSVLDFDTPSHAKERETVFEVTTCTSPLFNALRRMVVSFRINQTGSNVFLTTRVRMSTSTLEISSIRQ